MRMITFCAAALMVPPASAEAASLPFTATPLSGAALAQVTGTESPYRPLTSGNLLKLAGAQTRMDFRQAGLVNRVQMDVWWNTIGSELIANAVRKYYY